MGTYAIKIYPGPRFLSCAAWSSMPEMKPTLKPGANDDLKNAKQETKWFSTFAVYRLCYSETKKKHCLIRESHF